MCCITKRNKNRHGREESVVMAKETGVACTHFFILASFLHAAKNRYKYKNHFKGDIGMANYEKQEAAYPIPIFLSNCYRTVRHEELPYFR